MAWRILITASGAVRAGQEALAALRAAGCELAIPPTLGPLPAPALPPLLAGADAVLASLDDYSAGVLAAPEAASLKLISRWGVGYDAVDLAAATRAGMVVTNTPGLVDAAVADYAFALLLALARRVAEAADSMRRGEWRVHWGADVHGKTLGLVGCGRIGQAVARRARGFEMRVLGACRGRPTGLEQAGIHLAPLEQVLAESDFISLHAALTPASRGLIGEAEFRRLKPTALLINTARGALVDEAALLAALREGRLAGAALDVYATEPLPADHPLRTAPNLLLSPHQASFARETGARVSRAAAQAILDALQGRRPQHLLNPEVLHAPQLRLPRLRA